MTEAPTVSVVVPCYRRGDLLRECLESLRAQDFHDWEAIVVDDGTPSTEVEDTVADLKDPRMRYVRHQTNRGLAAARNTGYRHGRADIVLPLDSDDRLDPAFLAKTVRAFQDDPTTDCVFTDFQTFGDSQGVKSNRVGSLEDMLQGQWIPGPGTLQRKAIWEAAGGYCEPPIMSQECEWDFWLGACERGLNPVHIPEPLYLYRTHADAMSAGSRLREARQREVIYQRHKLTFAQFKRGSQFRATGYLNSATACFGNNQRGRTIRLTLRGLSLDPKEARLWRLLAIALLPAAWVDHIHERHLSKAARVGTGLRIAGVRASSVRPLRVTVVGPPELFAQRIVTLLKSVGIDARTPSPPSERLGALRLRLERIRRALATDAFLHVSGERDLKRLQVWLTQLGVPTVMLWIGSDVPKHAPHASRSVINGSWSWCVAPWLREELAEAGITADVVRLTPPQIPDPLPALPTRFTVLAYAADDREGLYGRDFVLELARRRPDIPFLLLAATSTDALPANVTALGWVRDMREVMSRTTLYVRPTTHDGLSNLVLEALANGRYVLWTYPFPGVEAADTLDTAEARLNELYRQYTEGRLAPNLEGRRAVLEMFEPAAVRRDTFERLTEIVEQGWRRPPGRFYRWIMRRSLATLRVLLRADRTWTTLEP